MKIVSLRNNDIPYSTLFVNSSGNVSLKFRNAMIKPNKSNEMGYNIVLLLILGWVDMPSAHSLSNNKFKIELFFKLFIVYFLRNLW